MARSGKGGLGRGLNSLLGGSYEEAIPEEEAPRSAPIEEEKPEKRVIEEESAPEKPVNDYVQREVIEEESEAFVDDGSQVTIKSVSARRTDEVPIDSIIPNPDQPRTNFKEEELQELADSIKKDGLLQPILVRPIGDNRYQIIAGERRWKACEAAGLETIPVRIKEADDDEAIELAMIENLQRTDLNPIEEAYGYRRLMERENLTQSQVAQVMSKGRSTIANSLRLLELPEEAQQLLFEEKISAGHARAILSIPSKEGRMKLTEKLATEKMSVREAESYARLLSNSQKAQATPRAPTPKSYKAVAKTLRDVLGTNVRVRSANGKNKIEIEFKDEEDLQRLFEQITASAEE